MKTWTISSELQSKLWNGWTTTCFLYNQKRFSNIVGQRTNCFLFRSRNVTLVFLMQRWGLLWRWWAVASLTHTLVLIQSFTRSLHPDFGRASVKCVIGVVSKTIHARLSLLQEPVQALLLRLEDLHMKVLVCLCRQITTRERIWNWRQL